MNELPAVDPDSWKPLFEPSSFNEAHGPLEVAEYKLTEDELKSWSERCMNIRRTIKEKARQLIEQAEAEVEGPADEVKDDVEGVEQRIDRTRRGIKKSRPEHNLER